MIHAHEYLAGRVALRLGRVLRCPVVVSEHYGGFARGVVPPDDRAVARDVFERAAVVCPVSGDLEVTCARSHRTARFETVLERRRRRGLPSGADDSHASGDTLRLVAVGNLVDVKGIATCSRRCRASARNRR